MRVCPYGQAWADQGSATDVAHGLAECSNMGTCDRTQGICSCRTGYEGIACDRKSCPLACNSRGACLSMQQYALTKDPGLGTVYVYNAIWDSMMIYGCLCDVGYWGPDCSLRDCPRGDDPLTGTNYISSTNPLQTNDVQQFNCKANAGTFTLSFKGYSTPKIPYNVDVSTLTTLISNLPSIKNDQGQGVQVGFGTTQACSQTGNIFSVTFLQVC